jgi:hypothetical protein
MRLPATSSITTLAKARDPPVGSRNGDAGYAANVFHKLLKAALKTLGPQADIQNRTRLNNPSQRPYNARSNSRNAAAASNFYKLESIPIRGFGSSEWPAGRPRCREVRNDDRN